MLIGASVGPGWGRRTWPGSRRGRLPAAARSATARCGRPGTARRRRRGATSQRAASDGPRSTASPETCADVSGVATQRFASLSEPYSATASRRSCPCSCRRAPAAVDVELDTVVLGRGRGRPQRTRAGRGRAWPPSGLPRRRPGTAARSRLRRGRRSAMPRASRPLLAATVGGRGHRRAAAHVPPRSSGGTVDAVACARGPWARPRRRPARSRGEEDQAATHGRLGVGLGRVGARWVSGHVATQASAVLPGRMRFWIRRRYARAR